MKEITIDVKTVELPKRVDTVALAMPKPETELRPGKLNYQGKIEVRESVDRIQRHDRSQGRRRQVGSDRKRQDAERRCERYYMD